MYSTTSEKIIVNLNGKFFGEAYHVGAGQILRKLLPDKGATNISNTSYSFLKNSTFFLAEEFNSDQGKGLKPSGIQKVFFRDIEMFLKDPKVWINENDILAKGHSSGASINFKKIDTEIILEVYRLFKNKEISENPYSAVRKTFLAPFLGTLIIDSSGKKLVKKPDPLFLDFIRTYRPTGSGTPPLPDSQLPLSQDGGAFAILVWIRQVDTSNYSPQKNEDPDGVWRNATPDSMAQIIEAISKIQATSNPKKRINIVLLGDSFKSSKKNATAADDQTQHNNLLASLVRITKEQNQVYLYDMTRFWENSNFPTKAQTFPNEAKNKSYAAQLFLLDLLFQKFNAKCLIGMMSGALDGVAFMGYPVIFFENEEKEARMGNLAAASQSFKRVEINKPYYTQNRKFQESELTELSKMINEVMSQAAFVNTLSLFPHLASGFSAAMADEPILINGMKVIFDQPVPLQPVKLQRKDKEVPSGY